MPRALATALSALLAAAPASAQVAPLFDGSKGRPPTFKADGVPGVQGVPVGGWEPAPPDQLPGDANPGAPERAGFWDRLQGNAFDQICKNIKLRTGQHVDIAGRGGAGLSIDRELQRTSAGTFALVDRAGLDLSGGWTQSLLSDAQGSLAISVNSLLHGESIVVRPLGTKQSCSEVGRLLDLMDVKAAIPLSPQRIAAMQVGELWRLPLTLDIGVGVGAGLKDFPASVSLGRAEEGRASVTLYRLAPDQVRFRLRIDKADIRTKGGDVVYTLPGAALGFPETQTIIVTQLVRLVNGRLADLVAHYLTTRLDAASTRRSGRMLMVEFVLDPRDANEMAALRQLMRGDLDALSILGQLVSRATRAIAGQRPAADELREVVGRHADDLGRGATFIGADDYDRRGSRLSITIPVLLSHQRTKDRDRDQVLILDSDGGEDTILKADRSRDWGFFDVPFLGQMTKHDTQRTAQVITHTDKAGTTTEPAAVFVRQEGFLRESASSAWEMAEQADRIASLIGTRGDGPSRATALPMETLFPAASLVEPTRDFGPRGQDEGPRPKQYHGGVSAFTLTFSRRAVADIVSAPAGVVLKAYAQALDASGREMLERVLPLMSLGADGRVRYDEGKALRALGYGDWQDQEARGAMSELARLAQTAADVVRDLASAREATTPQERARRFLDVMDGDGRSGLAYDDIARVLVQLADPADVSAEFYVNVRKGIKGEKDLSARLLLNPKAPDGALIGNASRDRARFAEPSILTD